MNDVNTAEERAASPIGALYPFIQHRKPECKDGPCVCGVREAVLAVEQAITGAYEALAWYADPTHYDDDFTPGRLVGGGWAGTEPQDADWDPDYGETARKALGLPDPWADEPPVGGYVSRAEAEDIVFSMMEPPASSETPPGEDGA